MPARDVRQVRRLFGKRLGKWFGSGAIAVTLLVLLALPFVPRVLRACGPYFPLELLSSREQAVLESPPAPWLTDGLAPQPGEKLPVDEGDNDSARARVEVIGLSAEQQERVKAMRGLSDGGAAHAAGKDLPPIVRDYTAGAVSYHHEQFDKARDYFTRALTHQPDDPREVRVVWARYMLGAIARLQGDIDGASAHWAATRGLVRAGATDPLGLAVASLGEEARLWLKPGTLAKAVSLYAKQASYGSERGRASLIMVAAQAIADPALLDEGLRDPTTRKVILRYLYTDRMASWAVETTVPLTGIDAFTRVLEAFERQRVSQVEGADLMAAYAYKNGQFDLAARLVAYESTPLSSWITGKLALRRGERQAALSSFAAAVKGLSADQGDRQRAMAETGVLHVSGGDFVQAMELFHAAIAEGSAGYGAPDYWPDLAYLAESVLTLDELLPVVDRLAPPLSQAEVDAIKKQRDGQTGGYYHDESAAERLRELAGRRLMRAGRFKDALAYFDADEGVRVAARKYIDAVTAARGQFASQGTSAEAWFAAAKVARSHGMEILGFELAPDYAIYDGNLEGVPVKPADLVARADKGVTAATPDERQRVQASTPAIDARFHYRLTAVDHAIASADVLPRKSQAFAAVLCRATSWIIDREPKRAAEVYARYLKEGPYVSWGAQFGRKCPQPDFAEAERRRQKERIAAVTWIYTNHPRRTTGGVTLVVVAGIAWFALRNRVRNKTLVRRIA